MIKLAIINVLVAKKYPEVVWNALIKIGIKLILVSVNQDISIKGHPSSNVEVNI